MEEENKKKPRARLETISRDKLPCDRMEKKIDKLTDMVNSIKTDVAINTKDLKEHMRRTAALEEALTLWRVREISVVLGIIAVLAKLLGLY